MAGLYFEEFTAGQVLQHSQRRTVTHHVTGGYCRGAELISRNRIGS